MVGFLPNILVYFSSVQSVLQIWTQVVVELYQILVALFQSGQNFAAFYWQEGYHIHVVGILKEMKENRKKLIDPYRVYPWKETKYIIMGNHS